MFSLDQLLDKHITRPRVQDGKEDAEQINSAQFKIVGNAIIAALGGCRKTLFPKKKKSITSRRTNPTTTVHQQDTMITLTLTLILNKDDSILAKIGILQPNQLQPPPPPPPPPPPTPPPLSSLSSPFPFLLLARQAKSHCRSIFKPQHNTRQSLLSERNNSILAQHALSLKEYKEAKAREHRQRMDALKADNVEEYLRLVADSKNTKIQMLMRQTDECLRKLAARLNCPIIITTTDRQDDNTGSNDNATNENTNENTPAPTPINNNNNNDKHSKFAAQIKASNSMWNQLSFQTFANIQGQPSTLVGGQLRQYQMQGLQWLAGLRNKGLNGILADEMGLGKTIQVIALICHIKEENKNSSSSSNSSSSDDRHRLPFLIAMPASVLPNWEKEFAHWAPGLKVVCYNGSQDNRQAVYEQYLSSGKKGKKRGLTGIDADVCLTTYELLMSNKEGKRSPLSRLQWSYIIVDEAHRLKNHNCKLNREMRHHYTSQHRLLLTGTPLSNSLEELWSLLNFLMPDLFNSTDDFQTWFGRSGKDDDDDNKADGKVDGDDGGDDDAAMLSQEEALLVTKRLHQVLRPFMLRRMKESVASELQKYEERMIPCHPSPYQQALFSLLQYQLVVGKKEVDAGNRNGNGNGDGLEENKGKKRAAAAAAPVIVTGTRVNNIMMEMRNISNHPFLSKLHPQGAEHIHLPLSHPLPHDLRLCSKLELLDRILIKLYAAKHKVLIFSTMTRALDVIEDHLAWRGFPCSRLDGNTPTHERGDIVDRFNNSNNDGGGGGGGGDPSFAFLLSFRAGGVGLNLQAADTVIMYDPEWNPQIDAQAVARCHRIGQDKKVLVLRLLTLGTVEERVFKVAGDKKGLAEASITAGFFDGATSAAEREKYLLNLIATQQQQQGSGIGGGGGGGGGKEGDPSSSSSSSTKKPPIFSSPSTSLSNQDINKLLARTDDELALFAAEDAKLESNELATWKHAIVNKNKEEKKEKERESSSHNYYSRLATGEDIAGLVQQAQLMAAPKPEEKMEDLGRGKRARLGVGAMKEPTTALGGYGGVGGKKKKVVKEVKEEKEKENSATIGPESDEKMEEEEEEEPKKENPDAECTEEESPKDQKKIPPPPPQEQQQQEVKKSERLALKRRNNENSSQGGDKKQKTM